MSGVEIKTKPATELKDGDVIGRPRARIFPVLATLGIVAVALYLGWQTWRVYVGAPWTRDGAVRAYVVTIAPEVAGRIVELPVRDNQLVRKGDLLMEIDPTDYSIAVRLAEAAVAQTQAVAQNAQAESNRRQSLDLLAVTTEEKQSYASRALSAEASYQQALANLDTARVNLDRTQIRSPVNGYVTNLLAQLGDYANIGQIKISLVDADSFWIDGYFEETNLEEIREGDPVTIKLMGYSQLVRGHVDSISRGINVPNAQPNASGLASVNPIFTFVRLAQRVPVRIHLDAVPDGVRLVAGMTATVQIDPRPPAAAARVSPPAPVVAPAIERPQQAEPHAGDNATEHKDSGEPLKQANGEGCAKDQGVACPPQKAAPDSIRRRAHRHRWR
jgi:multidrug resistance efflux pump